MGEFLGHCPCPNCGSSDAGAIYENDEWRHCHRCSHNWRDEESATNTTTRGHVMPKGARPFIRNLTTKPLTRRGIDEDTCKRYRYYVGEDEDGNECQVATFYKNGQPAAQKVRYPDKTFEIRGDGKRMGLFGAQLWRDGGRRIVVTEGEIDALSVAQALGNWPVVSIPNGAQSAARAVRENIEYLEGYGKVIFMFDGDEDGEKAAVECAMELSPGKAAIANLGEFKDANDMLRAGKVKELVNATWEAQTYRPDGLLRGEDMWELVSTDPKPGLPYPWAGLSDELYGMRTREVVTWCGGTKTGKTQLVKEVARHLALSSDQKVGIISLEESVQHAARCQMGLELGKLLHLPDHWAATTEAERKQAFDATLGTGRFFFYDHFGSIEADDILPKLRYWAKAEGVKYVVVDHISIMVSGNATEGDERKRLDELMTKMRTAAENLDIGIHLVSHLRKSNNVPFEEGGQISLDDLRGSGAIKQVSNVIIAAERDQQADDTNDRCVTTLRVLADRFTGYSGPACQVRYDPTTGRTVEHIEEDPKPKQKEETDEQHDF